MPHLLGRSVGVNQGMPQKRQARITMPNTPRAKILVKPDDFLKVSENSDEESPCGASLQIAPEILAEVIAKSQF